ncbi:MAG: molybdate ABC transporter substrate-binding protein [Epsilonproteobacteria bacterium]|nr:molybdate ABC transporter substrate-binding protein [Campylobacterota bacterium]NPA57259.1 molybdate ABC transporter substrate-binding protein [Campylobacterota bacterium]
MVLRVLALLIFIIGTLQAEVRVALAANMSFAMPKLIEEFHKRYPDIRVVTTIGGSGKLAAQIEHGADYDLFLSADELYPKRLYEKGRSYSRPVVYALGSLVVASRERALRKVEELVELGRVAMANPRTAPYGEAARELLQKKGIWREIEPKLVYGESIAQTVGYLLHGADAALIAKSVLYSSKVPKLHYLEVDPSLYTPIRQAMVLLKRGREGEALFTFLLSREAAQILEEFGYRVP